MLCLGAPEQPENIIKEKLHGIWQLQLTQDKFRTKRKWQNALGYQRNLSQYSPLRKFHPPFQMKFTNSIFACDILFGQLNHRLSIQVVYPFDHEVPFALSSTIITTSFTSIGCIGGRNHFARLVWHGRYSLIPRFQYWLQSWFEMRKHRRRAVPLSSSQPDSLIPLELPSRRWFGVSASPSVVSKGTYVRGLEFRIFSMSARVALKTSSRRVESCVKSIQMDFVDRIIRSHAPPM